MIIYDPVEANEFVLRAISNKIGNSCVVLNFSYEIFPNECAYFYWCEIKSNDNLFYIPYWSEVNEIQSLEDISCAFLSEFKNIMNIIDNGPDIDFISVVYNSLQIKIGCLEENKDIRNPNYFVQELLSDFIIKLNDEVEQKLSRIEIYNYCLSNFASYLYDNI